MGATAWAATAPDAGSWSATGSMAVARLEGHTTTLLPNGKVLVAGGDDGPADAMAGAELYDPVTGTWSPTGSLTVARSRHTATLLADGKVLVAGGTIAPNTVTANAELYDPATGTWSPTGAMVHPRSSYAAALLANGKVLAISGTAGSLHLASAELYDPATGTWSPTGNVITPRSWPRGVLLGDSRVLVVGGTSYGSPVLGAEIYDPATGSWSVTGSTGTVRSGCTVTLLADGRVLAAGGGWNYQVWSSAELYDPATGTWSPTGSMGSAFFIRTAARLADGKVLVAGGYNGPTDASASAELYDPATGTWSPTGSMTEPRFAHTAVLLADGAVLVVGGGNQAGMLASAELYRANAADTTPPVLHLPDDLTVEASGPTGAVVTFDATATDARDPAPVVTADPPSGSQFPLGTTTVSVTATDASGNTATGNFTVTVGYQWSGILQPVNADGSSIFKAGSTVPVKFALTGASAAVRDATARLSYAKISDNVEGTMIEAVTNVAATSGNLFRYDVDEGQYMFNWSTRGLSAGTYRLHIDLGDQITRTIDISLK